MSASAFAPIPTLPQFRGYARALPKGSCWFVQLKRGVCAAGLALGAVLTTATAPVWAETNHFRHPEQSEKLVYLTLEEALRRGAEAGPDVVVATAPRAALQQAVKRSHPLLSQVPVLSAQLGPRFTDGPTHPDVTVSVSQPVPLSNTGRAQEHLARAEKDAADKNFELTSLDAAERAGLAWIQLSYVETLLSLRKRAVAQAEHNLKTIESRVRVGTIGPTELALAQSEVAATKALVLEAEGQHFMAASDLAYLTGLGEGKRAEVRTRLSEPMSPAPDLSSQEPGTHPAVRAAEARADASKASVAYAKSQQVPNFAFGVQYQREGTGDQILSATMSLPLPLWKPWTYQETRQRAQYDHEKARARMIETELQLETERARHERSHAWASYDLIKTALLPPKKEAVRLAQAAFSAGEYDYLRVSWAERELLAAQEQLAAALSNVHRALLHLKRCTGSLKEDLP